MIELERVSKTYGEGAGRVEALRRVDLTIVAGQFVSIMGPSGSGKSTLLNLVSALDVPSSGTISIAGRDISRMSDDELTLFRRHQIGLVFQFFNLLPTISVLDNVLLPVMIERKRTQADLARAEELLASVGLRERSTHRPAQLSGGEMQRVAIARALIMKPSLILADEPTGNLDSTTGEAILSLLKETNTRTGTTIVMVTHSERAAAFADRALWLKDGLVVRDECTAATLSLRSVARTKEVAAEVAE
jgi:putative ABC transport system ATP-binding protein